MKIGKIVGIQYNRLRVKISSEIRGNAVNIGGQIYHFGNIGGFLKTTNAQEETIFCEVVEISDADAKKESMSFDMESNRELTLKPLGTIDKEEKFTLGVGIFPGLYSDVSIVTYDDMKKILQIEGKGNEKIHRSISLGISKNLINYPVEIGIDDFFNIHSAILGNTGSGKSNSIARIISEVHEKEDYYAKGSRILLFDVNGEYREAFRNKVGGVRVRYFKPNADEVDNAQGVENFYLPHFLLSLEEWAAFLMATDATQKPFWDKVLQESYRFHKINTSEYPDEIEKYAHYIRDKVCNMLNNVLRVVDTDTARMTTAAGLLNSFLALIEENDDTENQDIMSLKDDLNALIDAAELSFGSNNNRLAEKIKEIRGQTDFELARGILSYKLREGEYFNYKFLAQAAELVLLEEDARGQKQIRNYVATMMTRLNSFLDNSYCDFMKEHGDVEIGSAEDYHNYIWGDGDNRNQMVIIDTSQLRSDALETLTSVVSRILFDERKARLADRRTKEPVHLILDEAHRYIKKDGDYLLKENIFERIAREGRKFSFYLIVSSQRPSELSQTVLSQCGNFIIHRIQNENDMRYIQAVLPYFSEDFALKIKQSVPGEVLIFGNCVSMPLHVKINKANPEPSSKNCNVSEEWFIPENPASQQTSPSSADSPSNQSQEQPDDSSAESGNDGEVDWGKSDF